MAINGIAVSDIAQLNKQKKQHFFDKGSTKFFNSRYSSNGYKTPDNKKPIL